MNGMWFKRLCDGRTIFRYTQTRCGERQILRRRAAKPYVQDGSTEMVFLPESGSSSTPEVGKQLTGEVGELEHATFDTVTY